MKATGEERQGIQAFGTDGFQCKALTLSVAKKQLLHITYYISGNSNNKLFRKPVNWNTHHGKPYCFLLQWSCLGLQ